MNATYEVEVIGADPGFAPGDAAEFQLTIDEKCFAAPTGGKDVSTAFRSGKVDSNLEQYRDLKAYVDVWNYYVPKTPNEAYEQVAAACSPLAAYGARKNFSGIGDADTIGNFAVGVRQANALRARTRYWVSYTFDGSAGALDPSCMGRFRTESRARLEIQVLPNTCTYGLGVGLVPFECPFILGAPGCDNTPGPHDEVRRIVQGLCLPTGLIPQVTVHGWC